MSNPYSTPDNRDTAQESLNQKREVRGLQIITAGLAGGVLFFMAVTLFTNEGDISGQPDVVSWMGLVMACMMFVSHLILPNVIAGAALKKIDPTELQNADAEQKFAMLLPAFRTRHIIACAILEGAAFFNLIGYLLNQFAGNLVGGCPS